MDEATEGCEQMVLQAHARSGPFRQSRLGLGFRDEWLEFRDSWLWV